MLVLLLHLLLALAYASLTPLGEAPDEPAHLRYAQFIARQGRLPQTLAERTAAGYRSTWPPLYHLLLTGPLEAVGDTPPTRLKAVGDSPRRLIPTNGQTIAAFIHTDDEAWPWRGLPLAWHLGRIISTVLSTLALIPTYLIAWRLTRRRSLGLSATALQATIPQVLFVGSVLNDDNLLILLAGIILLILVLYTQAATAPGPGRLFLLGLLLGLAVVTKYNALPLWALAFVWVAWLRYRAPVQTHRTGPAAHVVSGLAVLLIGAVISSGWWFGFIWRHFNQIDRQGLWAGSLAAVAAGTADATLRQIDTGLSITWPTLAQWLEWFVTFFKSFWGLFGGGSTIELPAWSYWLLALFCLLAAIPYLKTLIARSSPRFILQPSALIPQPSAFIPLLLTPLFFLPLPLLRFLLSGSIVETAQGRHLFPALPAITLALIWGLHCFSQTALRSPLSAPRFILPTALILLTTLLSLYSLPLIRASYPPPIPLRTTADAVSVESPLQARLTDSISLVGYELGQIADGIVPLTLVWRAEATPVDDYLIELTLTAPTGQPIGGWLGHPLGGRYPSRAWDEGDILRHTIPVPIIPGQPATTATLTLTLREPTNLPSVAASHPSNQLTNRSTNLPLVATTSPLTLTTNLPPAPLPPRPPALLLPTQLRADGLDPEEPFTYRSTLSLALSEPAPPELIAPDGQIFAPNQFITGPTGSIAHFIVAANWPSGNYQLTINNYQLSIPIANRLRRFDPPPMQHTLEANFADRITLLGYDLPNRRIRPGESFPLTLHLRAEQTMGENLVIFNHLLDKEAVQRGGSDRIPQLYYTTLLWVPGEIVSDAYEVPVEPDAPPGIYWLDVGFYPSNQPNFSLPLFVDGRPIDKNSVPIGPLKIGGPPPNLTRPSVQPDQPLNQTFGEAITLLGFNLVDATGQPIQYSKLKTQPSELTLFWQPTATRSAPADYTVFVHLLDPAGNLVAQADSPPANGAYPTSLWDPGEIVVDAHILPDLPPGRYTLQVGLYNPITAERLAVEGTPEGAVRLMEFEVGE